MRKYVVLVVLLFAVLLLYSILPHPENPLTESQARASVMQDLSSLNADFRILDVNQTGSVWEFDVLVTTNAHSPCPTVERRYYKLPPVSFRPEPFITSCYERNKLLFREEALINSAKKLGMSDGYGCAFKAGANWFEEKNDYCQRLDAAAVSAFAFSLPSDAWVAYWEYNGGTKLIALDESGNVIKTV